MSVKKERLLVTVYRCERCGHHWFPRKPEEPIDMDNLPKKCAGCLSPLWNTERTREISEAKKARRRGD